MGRWAPEAAAAGGARAGSAGAAAAPAESRWAAGLQGALLRGSSSVHRTPGAQGKACGGGQQPNADEAADGGALAPGPLLNWCDAPDCHRQADRWGTHTCSPPLALELSASPPPGTRGSLWGAPATSWARQRIGPVTGSECVEPRRMGIPWRPVARLPGPAPCPPSHIDGFGSGKGSCRLPADLRH